MHSGYVHTNKNAPNKPMLIRKKERKQSQYTCEPATINMVIYWIAEITDNCDLIDIQRTDHDGLMVEIESVKFYSICLRVPII